ncbi:MAG: hypothetical protein HZA93_13705 [Verrucomicrobia bacterium]|nr:hypothetical protein [Verrucomicrobiota bacterium]
MRLPALFGLLVATASAAVPPALQAALDAFQAEPPPGWSFTQTTVGDGKSTVERCDAARPEFERWSLVQQDGRAPTDDETRRYQENRSRRSRGGTAPKLTSQFDLATLETLSDTAERATYRCPLKRTDPGDKTAEFIRATIVLHKPTRTIESLELGSAAGFKPTFGVTIAEMKTTMTYSLPAAEAPSLPQKVTVRMRGRALLDKSLDADLTVTFCDYAPAKR